MVNLLANRNYKMQCLNFISPNLHPLWSGNEFSNDHEQDPCGGLRTGVYAINALRNGAH